MRSLVVLGQTAIVYRAGGLGVTAVAWAAMVFLRYPLCRWDLGVQRRHPESLLRFL